MGLTAISPLGLNGIPAGVCALIADKNVRDRPAETVRSRNFGNASEVEERDVKCEC